MRSLPNQSVEWLNTSRQDPTGLLFQYEGEIYRAVYKNAVNKVMHLFESGIVKGLIDKGLLIDTQIEDFTVSGFGLVLHHKKIPFLSVPEDWSRSILLDAAKTVIKLNIALQKYGFATIDYHAHNIKLGDDSAPVWIDFGSIVPEKSGSVQGMNVEFSTWFIHSLILLSKSPNLGRICRWLYKAGGIRAEEFRELTGIKIEVSFKDRQTWLFSVLEWLENLKFPQYKGEWSNYYTSEDKLQQWDPFDKSFDQPNTRRGIIAEQLAEARPDKVIDIGCNTGLFSVLATRFCASVCSIDSDEWALDQFYHAMLKGKRGLPISLVLRNIGQAQHQQRSEKKADFVLALAVTHHMCFTQRLSFNYIAWTLSSYSTNILVTEFMPDGLGIGRPSPDPIPREYTLENFIKSLTPYFDKIEHIKYPSGPSKRIFVICEGRTKYEKLRTDLF